MSSDEEEHPVSRTAIAASATDAAPGWFLRDLDLLLWALEVTVPFRALGGDEMSRWNCLGDLSRRARRFGGTDGHGNTLA